jgi:hypothetical protein
VAGATKGEPDQETRVHRLFVGAAYGLGLTNAAGFFFLFLYFLLFIYQATYGLGVTNGAGVH